MTRLAIQEILVDEGIASIFRIGVAMGNNKS